MAAVCWGVPPKGSVCTVEARGGRLSPSSDCRLPKAWPCPWDRALPQGGLVLPVRLGLLSEVEGAASLTAQAWVWQETLPLPQGSSPAACPSCPHWPTSPLPLPPQGWPGRQLLPSPAPARGDCASSFLRKRWPGICLLLLFLLLLSQTSGLHHLGLPSPGQCTHGSGSQAPAAPGDPGTGFDCPSSGLSWPAQSTAAPAPPSQASRGLQC